MIGLSYQEAAKRLMVLGPNKLPESKRLSRGFLFFKQFQNPLVYILLVVILISFFTKHYIDAGFILLVVLINNLVSFIQEDKSEKALAALQKMIKKKARVIRQGQENEIDAQELVPGDIIVLRPGDQVPADARLFEVNNLQIDEAALTGEFWPVKKDLAKDNLVYLGTNVEQGLAKAVVFATGQQTKIGSLALIVRHLPSQKTPLQKRMAEFSRILASVIIGLGLLVFLISRDFYTAIALVVSAIPEGLLPVVTVVLVVGMGRVLKNKGLVRKLMTAETLGSVTVLCIDKTGTLTTGQMTVTDLITENQELAWQIMTKCNEAILTNGQVLGRPTDRALLSAGLQAGFKQNSEERLALLPFDAQKKYLAVLYPKTLYVAGAPEILLPMAEIKQEKKEKWIFNINQLSRQGLRLIGLAWKETSSLQDLEGLKFIGLAVLKDPLRSDAKEAMDICQQAGIRLVMVTGDHQLTAKNIAQELGLATNLDQLINGSEINEAVLKRIREINVFSRVSPEQKLQIVSAWQEQGEIVAMTGDGVNDAPALKKADIGIALASGTDMSKEVADLVLLKNSFKTIVAAIEQGRIMFENIKKAILYLLSTDFSEIILILLAVLFGLPLPLLPAQILWINIIEDTFPGFALALEPGEKQVMQDKIRARKILDQPIRRLMMIIGLATGVISFLLFICLWKILRFDLDKIRTMIFAVEALSSLLFVFSCRSLRQVIWRKDILSNYWLMSAAGFGLLLLISAVYLPWLQFVLRTTPLNSLDWLIVGFASILSIVIIELFKQRFVFKKN